MTEQQIIEWAREAGFPKEVPTLEPHAERLARFAALVAAHERERCANEADSIAELKEASRNISPDMYMKFAAGCSMDTATQIADAIRALKD